MSITFRHTEWDGYTRVLVDNRHLFHAERSCTPEARGKDGGSFVFLGTAEATITNGSGTSALFVLRLNSAPIRTGRGLLRFRKRELILSSRQNFLYRDGWTNRRWRHDNQSHS
jgi:hypothetical protein